MNHMYQPETIKILIQFCHKNEKKFLMELLQKLKLQKDLTEEERLFVDALTEQYLPRQDLY